MEPFKSLQLFHDTEKQMFTRLCNMLFQQSDCLKLVGLWNSISHLAKDDNFLEAILKLRESDLLSLSHQSLSFWNESLKSWESEKILDEDRLTAIAMPNLTWRAVNRHLIIDRAEDFILDAGIIFEGITPVKTLYLSAIKKEPKAESDFQKKTRNRVLVFKKPSLSSSNAGSFSIVTARFTKILLGSFFKNRGQVTKEEIEDLIESKYGGRCYVEALYQSNFPIYPEMFPLVMTKVHMIVTGPGEPSSYDRGVRIHGSIMSLIEMPYQRVNVFFTSSSLSVDDIQDFLSSKYGKFIVGFYLRGSCARFMLDAENIVQELLGGENNTAQIIIKTINYTASRTFGSEN